MRLAAFQRPSGRRVFRMAVCYPSFTKSPATVDCKEKPADPKDHQAELPNELPYYHWPNSHPGEATLLGPFQLVKALFWTLNHWFRGARH